MLPKKMQGDSRRRRRQTRKKLVVSKSVLKARACKGLADANVTFCGKGAVTEHEKSRKFNLRDENRGVHRDVAYPGGFEPLAFGVGVQRSIQLSYGYICFLFAHRL